ncbi:uncharacterized protein MYCFIDRAFT_41966 [Pseudocercospora fijiensis CIRAD86]|uniref:Uncharacterized protein n=1 Tax=Pseudocercospora fijiensis (strain CIRAD86) TaxID=383855 RepID=M3B772_PSEFD|nr:uncharacterized protein MYCFIDRAFT_41966 [Pseudocercospora fijiensis CIRAD86]EME85167.1 hypothetical protein MYCFIDRAFT_41966 [Pseudocercospora fijiensis CIRAD86]
MLHLYLLFSIGLIVFAASLQLLLRNRRKVIFRYVRGSGWIGCRNADESRTDSDVEEKESDLEYLKALFYQLNNLERFPDVLPKAREILVELLAQCLKLSLDDRERGIDLPSEYSQNEVERTILEQHDRIGQQFKAYVARRQAGLPREMFSDRASAVAWLRDQAPAKLVDGAWLGHIHRFSTSFDQRPITRLAWQIMSEELGDGDVAKNHVFVYRELLENSGVRLPAADSKDFLHPQHKLHDVGSWKTALSHLLVSLFPHDFLPEILGFNMHFEQLTWSTLCAATELRELGLDPYYFLLHISIDNVHSGHTAMAQRVAFDFLEHVQERSGPSAASEAWRRVQAGYALSRYASQTSSHIFHQDKFNFNNRREKELVAILRQKALASQWLHCSSKVKLGNRPLSDWFSSKDMGHSDWGAELLQALASASPWVYPGKSYKSRLVQALSWKGKMFGAFSTKELCVLREWIDGLTAIHSNRGEFYWKFTQRKTSDLPELGNGEQDILLHYPVLGDAITPQLDSWLHEQSVMPLATLAFTAVEGDVDILRLIPLWFAGAALLEGLVSNPAKTCGPAVSALLGVVRAQHGLVDDFAGCTGLDESSCADVCGLHELGMSIIAKAGMQTPRSLKQVYAVCGDCPEATMMLHLSMRPLKYAEVLSGMSMAFACFHDILCVSRPEILPAAAIAALKGIAAREKAGLQVYHDEISDVAGKTAFNRGFYIAKRQLEQCYHTG